LKVTELSYQQGSNPSNLSKNFRKHLKLKIAILYLGTYFSTDIGMDSTEPANYTGSYTADYRVIIAGILNKGVIKKWQ
jgi:hypothetical protein